jgi:hypothetical protein
MAEEIKSASEQQKEDWMNSKWRPMMGWMYMAVCSADFMLFPVLWSVIQVIGGGEVKTQWQPITLQGAGLFHIAMGAVLGLAAWGRTQEKLGGANNGGLAPVSQSVTTTFGQPQSGGFGTPAPSTSFTPAPSWGATPIATKSAPTAAGNGKLGPAPAAEPEL